MGGIKERSTSYGFLTQMPSFADSGGRASAPNATRCHFGRYDGSAIQPLRV
jgi:hypothetical protein